MTLDERLIQIANMLDTLVRVQAQQSADIEKQSQNIEKQSQNIEKQTAGMRDLIVVIRTLLESQQRDETRFHEHDERFRKLEEMQEATFLAIGRLTENIDRWIRHGRNGGE